MEISVLHSKCTAHTMFQLSTHDHDVSFIFNCRIKWWICLVLDSIIILYTTCTRGSFRQTTNELQERNKHCINNYQRLSATIHVQNHQNIRLRILFSTLWACHFFLFGVFLSRFSWAAAAGYILFFPLPYLFLSLFSSSFSSSSSLSHIVHSMEARARCNIVVILAVILLHARLVLM